MMRCFSSITILAVVGQVFFPVWAAAEVDYVRDIKPILAEKCYACHGGLRQQSGLRVDTAAALIRGGDSGSVVTPGQADKSPLLEVLTGEAGYRMPLENEGTPLTDQQISLIRQWIAEGAVAPKDEQPQTDPTKWWSYRPVVRPPLPNVSDDHWCRNGVDHFIAAAREERGLPYAEEVSKPLWLRRVTIDLTGLPPTREELHRFLADESPQAYERVVDDLLARPSYGERWGRHWLDIWRYSDWYGSRRINEIRYSQRHIWRWRDWVVESLNKDKGYDQMIREMLCADEICGGDPAILPATGYLGRNWYKFDRNVWLFETVERTGEAFLGLTFRCARCHDHKFDPVTQEEYYRFRAFFEPHDVRTDPISALTGTQKDATLGQVLTDGIPLVYDKTLEAPTYRFERGDSRYPDESQPLTPGVPAALGGAVDIQPVELPVAMWYPVLRPGVRETLLRKAALERDQARKKWEEARSKAQAAAQALAQADDMPEESPPPLLLHDDFSKPRPDLWQTVNGTWRYEKGRLVQSAVTHFATMVTKKPVTGDFQIHLVYRPLQPGTYRSVGFSFDYLDQGNSQDVYTSTGDTRQSVQAFHRLHGKQIYPKAGIVPTSLSVGEEAVLDVVVMGSHLTIDLNGERKLDYTMPEQRRDGKFSLWVHKGAAEFLELKITQLRESRETLARRQQAADHDVAVAQGEYEVAQAEFLSVEKRLAAEVARFLNRDESMTEQLVSEAVKAELDVAVKRAALEVVQAGNMEERRASARKKLEAARAAFEKPPSDYTPLGAQYLKTSTGRRSALAAWITRRENPRTARVAVNHIWSRHFGRPLVATPENFGLNGRQPTHPELLDWLASELMDNGWKMKPLHKVLVLSATYRMASTLKDEQQRAQTLSQDAQNDFFWRMNPRRLEAEVVRDGVLALSDQLDSSMGGPELSEQEGERIPRRSLYFRNTPNEKMAMLEIFDMANPNECYRRKESVVPQQSLAMMNSGLTQDAARRIAHRLAGEPDFVTVAFETVLTRGPTPAEAERCRKFLLQQQTLFEDKNRKVFPSGGTATQPPAGDPDLRAKENLLLVLLMHNDFVTLR